jgi:hypothetical protein
MGLNSIYYFAAWTDSGCLLGCDHKHQTVSEAVACISCAGGYVIAVENRVLRALTDDEEAEFQRALGLAPSSKLPELEYEASGFAVMVRVRFVDGWGWDTWMRFDTYEQAAAHARKGNKVVPFGSVEWNALRQKREPALPAPASAPQESRPSRYEGETFVEFVSRLAPSPLDHHDLTDRETLLSVSTNSVRTPVIKSQTLVELVLKLINKWELSLLERIYSVLVSATASTSAFRRQMRKALRDKSGIR